MSNCGNCRGQVCACIVTGDGSTTFIGGNGSNYSPFTVRPDHVPNPRPTGYIIRATTQSITANTFTAISFSHSSHPFEGGMTNLVSFPTRLTAPATGKYLMGGYVTFGTFSIGGEGDLLIVRNGNEPTDTLVRKSSQANPAGFEDVLSAITLASLNIGDFIELWVRVNQSGITTRITSGDVVNMPDCRPYFWAQWMGA